MSKDLKSLLNNEKILSLQKEYDLTDEEFKEYVSNAYINYRSVLPEISKFRGRVKMCIVIDKTMGRKRIIV